MKTPIFKVITFISFITILRLAEANESKLIKNAVRLQKVTGIASQTCPTKFSHHPYIQYGESNFEKFAKYRFSDQYAPDTTTLQCIGEKLCLSGSPKSIRSAGQLYNKAVRECLEDQSNFVGEADEKVANEDYLSRTFNAIEPSEYSTQKNSKGISIQVSTTSLLMFLFGVGAGLGLGFFSTKAPLLWASRDINKSLRRPEL
jgi:hypothetical protein